VQVVESRLDLLDCSIIVGTTRIPFRRSLSGSSGIQQSFTLLVLIIEVRYLLVVLVMLDMKRMESYTGA
jgi:hypothetical protein